MAKRLRAKDRVPPLSLEEIHSCLEDTLASIRLNREELKSLSARVRDLEHALISVSDMGGKCAACLAPGGSRHFDWCPIVKVLPGNKPGRGLVNG